MLAVDFSYMAFSMFMYVSSILILFRVLIMNRCWILSKAFSCIYWCGHIIFILQFVNVMYNLDWFFYPCIPGILTWLSCMILLMYIWIWFVNIFLRILYLCSLVIRSDQISRSVVSYSLRPHESQHARPPCPSPTPGVHWDSRPLSHWCHPAISSSVVPFSSFPQPLPASESFPMSQLFAWGGQSTGGSALTSFLPKKSQGWSPSEWTGWISLQSKGLSRVFSNTTVQRHQIFSAQPSSQSNSH